VDGSVIGISAGGTRTVCLRATGDARISGEWHGPGANLQAERAPGIERVLADGIAAVLRGAPEPDALCVGMAGADRAEDFAAVSAVLARICPHARSVVVNDALIALEAGVPGGAGSVLIAGTGSIAYGRDARGRAARAGGWGYVLGDEGSGYWLGRQALRAVVRGSDGRGRVTSLTPRVLAHYGLTGPKELVRQMSGRGAQPAAIAQLAPLVAAAAEEGDEVARHLVAVAAIELAAAAESVVRRLDLQSAPLIMTGGILVGFHRLRETLVAELRARLPGLTPVLLEAEPAIGAVRLGCQALAGTFVLPVYVE
jgi:N-acetylglucosamine kinase-like BadF-type ATPase